VTDLVRARVEDHLVRLRLGAVAARLDAILSDAARKEPSYLAFLDTLLGEELDAKQKKRVAMGIQIAHFPVVKTLDEISDDDISGLNIPTGMPLIYELDDSFVPVTRGGRYLDPEAARAAAEAVAKQGR